MLCEQPNQRSPSWSPNQSQGFDAGTVTHLPVEWILQAESFRPHSSSPTIEHLLFSYRAIAGAIQACTQRMYTAFDAHTTTTCCHGVSVYVLSLLSSAKQYDLEGLHQQVNDRIALLIGEIGPEEEEKLRSWPVPHCILELAKMYMLAKVKERRVDKGGRTLVENLKQISPVGYKFCKKTTKYMQRHVATTVAKRYQHYLTGMTSAITSVGISSLTWGKYVGDEYLREDSRGVLYASSLFSMQVVLAQLIRTRAKIALVNDIRCSNGSVQARYIRLFEGDGYGGFVPLELGEFEGQGQLSEEEPLVVFGGCTYGTTYREVSISMDVWLDCFPGLVLACDTHYPQFPKVRGDAEFNGTPIIPSEECLRAAITSHNKVEGVSAHSPVLFCLTHVYPASIAQVQAVARGHDDSALPYSFICEDLSAGKE